MRQMKLKKEYVTHSADGETLLIATGNAGFSGIVKGNKTFAAILELLQADTTEEAVVAAMAKRFDAPADVIAADVKKAVAQLRQIGAIDG